MNISLDSLPWAYTARRPHPMRLHALVAGIGLAMIICGVLA